ncbi:glycosyltransferase family 2 protein [Pseudohaliea rubra]|uniref:Glycosyl transferase, group 2 family protein n=1 Tax=Pseudohaliea rubra DSM 19751 TaxID=1265313 RepID=A0A095XTV5_9GAMM|nr:glycosyltransferase family 2 protein [Pseudohaliea rubra]KGE03071.1 Glycosyl transferase, group 2 family protein [Pseudohaliea rubra DSM 19751]
MTALVTIVIPVFNERAVLPALHRRLAEVLAAAGERSELLFVDDGSDDGSGPWLEALAAEDSRVSLLSLSRNFGKEAAVSAGLDHARGEAVIVIDADLQDPPELIPELLRRWREGFDIVYTVRASRRGESWLKVGSARWFYRVMGRLSAVPVPADAGDYRLLSRRAVDAVRALPESHRYLKGLYAWVGFPQACVTYHREARAAGKSKWSYWRLWNHALDGITSFSAAPLKLATWLGLATSTLAFLYGLYLLLRTLLYGNPVPGYPSLLIVVLFLGGVQLICLGIIGEYLGRTYDESKRRPLYLVKGYRPGADD